MKRLIDLTVPIGEGMPVWPGDPLFRQEQAACLDWDGFSVVSWTIGSHLGTHLDSPRHFFQDGETFEELPLELFYGTASLIDLSSLVKEWYKINKQEPFAIQVEHLLPFESLLEKYSRVLVRTDWSLQKDNPDYWMKFPSFTPETVDWIADYPIRLLGLETPSLCAFPLSESISSDRDDEEPLDELTLHADSECHRILLGRRPPVLLLENLCNLSVLPETFELSCFPLPIKGADGSPVRAIAFVDEE